MISSSSFLFIFILLFSSFLSFSSSSIIPSFFNVGVIISIKTSKNNPSVNLPFLGAILMAFDQINNKTDGIFDDILPNTYLKFIYKPATNKYLQGAIVADRLLQVDPINGVIANIGPFGNYSLQGAIPTFREAAGVSVIGFNDRAVALGNSDFYPNFLRTVPALYQDGFVIATLIANYFRWDKITVFSTNTDSGRASVLTFRHYAAKYGIKILSSHVIDRSRTSMISPILDAKEAGARIFVLFLDPLVGKRVIDIGKEYKVFNQNTQIIGGEEFSTPLSWAQMKLSPVTLNELLGGYIGVVLDRKAPSSQLKEQFLHEWINHKSTAGYVDNNGISYCDTRMDSYNSSYVSQFYTNDDPNLPIKCAGIDYPSYATHTNLETELDEEMYGYDAVLSVATSLHELIYTHKNYNPTPVDLYNYLVYNLSFTGLTGKLQYSTEMELDHWDVGGRITEMVYGIVNYVPFDLISNPSLDSSNLTFRTVLEWHSENGFTLCEGHSHYIHGNPCHEFTFQTKSVPVDSPPANVQTMTPAIRVILRIISLLGVSFVAIVILIIFLYRKRRFVKMSQPSVAIFQRIGILLGFVRVFLTSVQTTTNICHGRLWLDHMAFQLIFSTLFIRSCRIYLVAGTMKRIKISDGKCIAFIAYSIFTTFLFLVILSVQGDISVKYVTTVETQFEYTIQPACDYGSRNLIYILYVYDGIILLSGLVTCWMVRNVQSTVSNTSVLVEAIMSTAAIVLIVFILINIYPMKPVVRQFFVSTVICLLLIRMIWVFESQIIYRLFAGYELDRALFLRKTERNVLEIIGLAKLSNKILAINQDDNTASMSQGRTTEKASGQGDEPMIKGLEKYAKLKNQEELTAEIIRVKDDLKLRQIELACLENMMFASDNDGGSSSNTGSKGKSNDHRYSYDSGNHQQGGESGADSNLIDMEKAPPLSPHTITGKIQLSGKKSPVNETNGN